MENETLIADLLQWVYPKPRPYTEVMSAWQTSCPRLTIWEDAVDAGLVRVEYVSRSAQRVVKVTQRGAAFLKDCGRLA